MPALKASIERVILRYEAPGHSGRAPEATDADLVEQVRGGDAVAFGELVERHRGAVYRAARAALGNDADAEDVAQDAFVLAFKRISQFRGEASVRTWLISIAWRLSRGRSRPPHPFCCVRGSQRLLWIAHRQLRRSIVRQCCCRARR